MQFCCPGRLLTITRALSPFHFWRINFLASLLARLRLTKVSRRLISCLRLSNVGSGLLKLAFGLPRFADLSLSRRNFVFINRNGSHSMTGAMTLVTLMHLFGLMKSPKFLNVILPILSDPFTECARDTCILSLLMRHVIPLEHLSR